MALKVRAVICVVGWRSSWGFESVFFPRFPTRPFTPAGVKGSLNSQFIGLDLDKGLGA